MTVRVDNAGRPLIVNFTLKPRALSSVDQTGNNNNNMRNYQVIPNIPLLSLSKLIQDLENSEYERY